ncbi:hypothetical protein ACFXOM_29135 [Streptomyces sp. NPDC059169]|uniref:hypothetical protein n=1 Tax=unclassified Streptomyces TaxID=2593676 RepID=UPI0036BA51C6
MAVVIEALASLSESESDLVARLAISRYARLALLPGTSWWAEALPHGFHEAVEDATQWDQVAPSTRAVVRLESLVDEALELMDETPTGGLYYPYQAAAVISHSCWGLGEGRGHAKFLSRLWEDAQRYARHVDWQLTNSRIPTETVDWFQNREKDLWRRHTRLSGAEDAVYEALAAFSREVAGEYTDALSCALSDAATADFVLILDDGSKGSFEPLIERWGAAGRKARFDSSIYPGRMDDGNRTYFDHPAFLYVWGGDEGEVADLLRSAGVDRVLVDVRSQDGSVIEGPGFIADPVKSVTAW